MVIENNVYQLTLVLVQCWRREQSGDLLTQLEEQI